MDKKPRVWVPDEDGVYRPMTGDSPYEYNRMTPIIEPPAATYKDWDIPYTDQLGGAAGLTIEGIEFDVLDYDTEKTADGVVERFVLQVVDRQTPGG